MWNQWGWGLNGRAEDALYVPTSNSAGMGVSVDNAWQKQMYINPSIAPEAGHLMLQDASIALAEEMAATNNRYLAPVPPMMAPQTMQTGKGQTAPVGSTTVHTFGEPPLDPNAMNRQPMSPPPADDFDGGHPDTKDTNWGADSAMDDLRKRMDDDIRKGPVGRESWKYMNPPVGPTDYDWMLEDERRRQAAIAAQQAASQTPSGFHNPTGRSSVLPILLGVGALAGIAWWMSRGSSPKAQG